MVNIGFYVINCTHLVLIYVCSEIIHVCLLANLFFSFACLFTCKSFLMSFHLYFYQNQFDNIYRKYITYTGGEELFGLPVTQYPQLLEIKKQLNLLQKIYALYNSVIETVNSYHDILWSEVNIEKINSELSEFQNR